MSEVTQEKPPEITPAPPAAPPAGPPLPMLIGVLAGALALGAAAGAIVIAPRIVAARAAHPAVAKADGADEKDGKEGKDGKGKGEKRRVFRLENLIVNPAGSGGTRFLMAGVAFEVPDEKIEARLKDREVQVRDMVVSILETQTVDMITRSGARDTLKRELEVAVSPIAGTRMVRVYLPQFVVQ